MTQWGLDNLFNPGKRHMDDEKRRLQSTREEIGDASGGRRIDLEGGTVSISVRRPAAESPDAEPAAADDAALDPALEAEEMPAVALANDEAEIVPALVDEPAGHADALQEDLLDSVAAVEAVAVEAPAVEAPAVEAPAVEAPAVVEPEPEPAAEPEPAPAPTAEVEPEPEPTPAPAAPRRRTQSASAWSRGG